MNGRKKTTVAIASIVFLVTAIIIYSGVFNHSQSVFIENPLDHFYMVIVNIFFWLPAAYLLNTIFDKLIWKKVVILPVGNTSARWLQDFVWSLIYIVAITVTISSAFFVEITGTAIFVMLLIYLIQSSIN